MFSGYIHFTYGIMYFLQLWPSYILRNKGLKLGLSKGGVVVWVSDIPYIPCLRILFMCVETFRKFP